MKPEWLDHDLYPFASHTIELEQGKLHYLDEGSGSPLVMVHGTPTWSFLWRKLIPDLAQHHRVIAPDHLGFGLSKAQDHFSYRHQAHAEVFEAFMERLELDDMTLVVHDFGGPIGLNYAIKHPEKVRRLIVFNTWLWSLREDPEKRRVGNLMASRLGRFLYHQLNVSPRFIVPSAMGERKLSKLEHGHYLAPFSTPASRYSAWMLACDLIAAHAWHDSLWAQREALTDKPCLLVWGMRDPAFKGDALERWQACFPRAEVLEYATAGHFVMEEAGQALVPPMQDFIGGT